MDFDARIPYSDELLASRDYDTLMTAIAATNQSFEGMISKSWLKRAARDVLGYSYYQANQHAKNLVSLGVLREDGKDYRFSINPQAALNGDMAPFVYGTFDRNTINYFFEKKDSTYLRYYLYLVKRSESFFKNNRERPFFYYGGRRGASASLGYNPNSPSVAERLKEYTNMLVKDGLLQCHRTMRPFGGDRDTIVVEIDTIGYYTKTTAKDPFEIPASEDTIPLGETPVIKKKVTSQEEDFQFW